MWPQLSKEEAVLEAGWESQRLLSGTLTASANLSVAVSIVFAPDSDELLDSTLNATIGRWIDDADNEFSQRGVELSAAQVLEAPTSVSPLPAHAGRDVLGYLMASAVEIEANYHVVALERRFLETMRDMCRLVLLCQESWPFRCLMTAFGVEPPSFTRDMRRALDRASSVCCAQERMANEWAREAAGKLRECPASAGPAETWLGLQATVAKLPSNCCCQLYLRQLRESLQERLFAARLARHWSTPRAAKPTD